MFYHKRTNFEKKKDHLFDFTNRFKCYQSELFHPLGKTEAIQLVKIYYSSRQTQSAGEIECLDSYFLNEKGKQN